MKTGVDMLFNAGLFGGILKKKNPKRAIMR
jgi:hypothetical protein